MNKIITIARQCGSGGHEIGERLASEYGIPFYDKEIIELAAKESGISKELFEGIDEKATNSLLYSLAIGTYSYGNRMLAFPEISLNDRLFMATSEVIKKASREGPCVIVGRCADYVLRDNPACVHIWIYADLDYRIKRISESRNIPENKAKDVITKTDKRRSSYYNYYSDKKWDRVENYDMCINGKCGIDKSVSIIKAFIETLES